MNTNTYCRPEFIPSDVFREYLTTSQLNKHARISGILPASFIAKMEREGKPIKSKRLGTSKAYRLIDVIAAARANCYSVQPSQARELTADIDALTEEKRRLVEEINSLRDMKSHELSMHEISRKLTGNTLLREHEIAECKMEFKALCGVYFLLKDKSVVYVGQSTNIMSRLAQHMINKDFDGFSYLPCAKDSLDKLESLYIHYFRPYLNGKTTSHDPGIVAPLKLEELISIC